MQAWIRTSLGPSVRISFRSSDRMSAVTVRPAVCGATAEQHDRFRQPRPDRGGADGNIPHGQRALAVSVRRIQFSP